MAIVFHADYYFIGVWFIPHNPTMPMEDRVDWLCAVWCEAPGQEWIMRYRFRYHTGGPRPDADDEKRWYETRISGEIDETIVEQKVSKVAYELAQRIKTQIFFVPVRGSGDKGLSILGQQSWAHITIEEKQDNDG